VSATIANVFVAILLKHHHSWKTFRCELYYVSLWL